MHNDTLWMPFEYIIYFYPKLRQIKCMGKSDRRICVGVGVGVFSELVGYVKKWQIPEICISHMFIYIYLCVWPVKVMHSHQSHKFLLIKHNQTGFFIAIFVCIRISFPPKKAGFSQQRIEQKIKHRKTANCTEKWLRTCIQRYFITLNSYFHCCLHIPRTRDR